VKNLLGRLTVLVVSSALALYGVETYLDLHGAPRTGLNLLLELRQRGVEAYPAYSPAFRLKVPPGIMPLSGVRLATTVIGGDLAPSVYESDEFGFRNPAGLWNETPDIAILGDSFVQGFGAEAGTDIGSVMRMTYPRTLNLGVTGTGQLAQLAIAREYLTRIRPRRVVVLYFEGNDVVDTANELVDPDLGRYYFDDGYRQGLADRVAETDRGLRDSLDAAIAREAGTLARARSVPIGARLGRIARLRSLSTLLMRGASRLSGLSQARCGLPRDLPASRVVVDETGAARWEPIPAGAPVLEDTEARRRERLLIGRYFSIQLVLLPEGAYAAILHKLASTVEGFGGRLYFAYLPSPATVRDPGCDPNYDAVRGLVREAGIGFIDVGAALRGAGDPDSLYVTHLTPKGGRVVANAVLEHIAAER